MQSLNAYAKTFANSLEGEMRKLSLELDQEMRCWMVWSSSMLRTREHSSGTFSDQIATHL